MAKENFITYSTFQRADHSTPCSARKTQAIRMHPKWIPMRHSGLNNGIQTTPTAWLKHRIAWAYQIGSLTDSLVTVHL